MNQEQIWLSELDKPIKDIKELDEMNHTITHTRLNKFRLVSIIIGIICLLSILLAYRSVAQVQTDWGAGYDLKAQKPLIHFTFGYEFHNVVADAGLIFSPSSVIKSNKYIGVSTGYRIKYFEPFVSFYYDKASSDYKKLNKKIIGYGVKVLIPLIPSWMDNYSGAFINAVYTDGICITAGIHAVL